MNSNRVSLKTIYLELAFWAATASGTVGIIIGGIEVLPGVGETLLIGLIVTQSVLAFLGAALLRRGAGEAQH